MASGSEILQAGDEPTRCISQNTQHALARSDVCNKFSCDCRLSWILHLVNATRNAKFRRELRHIKCEFENGAAAPANVTANNKVVRLSLKQLGCAEDYERPAVGHEGTTVPPVRHPNVDDDDDADATGGLGHSDEFSSDTRPDQHAIRDEVSSITNDVEVILNQRKSVENDSSVSSTRSKSIVGSASDCHLAESTLVSCFLVLCVLANDCYRCEEPVENVEALIIHDKTQSLFLVRPCNSAPICAFFDAAGVFNEPDYSESSSNGKRCASSALFHCVSVKPGFLFESEPSHLLKRVVRALTPLLRRA
ncbi:hypothetical protein HPB51_014753 [Rhipicephalus microplus]|uniref:Uncharacterized protein n=1 Tax=Rhipicephalus microplus TaxID=6941 RepID=A0A9J6DNN1_RHIMP|nr:hypothetical protein HPB51_014753 [Rhipicephalus microplus]